MGQAESRAISDVGAFALNLIERPGQTITSVVTNPSQTVASAQSTVLNEGQKPVTNTSNYQTYDPTEEYRKAFQEIESYRPPEESFQTTPMGTTSVTTNTSNATERTTNRRRDDTSPSGKLTTKNTALVDPFPTGKKV